VAARLENSSGFRRALHQFAVADVLPNEAASPSPTVMDIAALVGSGTDGLPFAKVRFKPVFEGYLDVIQGRRTNA